jgi:hypothetical protein
MVTVSGQAIKDFNSWKIRDEGKYLSYHIVDDKVIEVFERGPKSNSSEQECWEDFLQNFLKDDKSCWVTYHFGYTTKEGGKRFALQSKYPLTFYRSKTILIQWIPSKAPAKHKMQYAMWTNTIKQSLSGIQFHIQGGSKEEISFDEVLQRVSKFEQAE